MQHGRQYGVPLGERLSQKFYPSLRMIITLDSSGIEGLESCVSFGVQRARMRSGNSAGVCVEDGGEGREGGTGGGGRGVVSRGAWGWDGDWVRWGGGGKRGRGN